MGTASSTGKKSDASECVVDGSTLPPVVDEKSTSPPSQAQSGTRTQEKRENYDDDLIIRRSVEYDQHDEMRKPDGGEHDEDRPVANLKLHMLRLKREQRDQDQGKMKLLMEQQQQKQQQQHLLELQNECRSEDAPPTSPPLLKTELPKPEPSTKKNTKQRAGRRMSMVAAKDLESLPPFVLVNVSQIVIRYRRRHLQSITTAANITLAAENTASSTLNTQPHENGMQFNIFQYHTVSPPTGRASLCASPPLFAPVMTP